jgi:hypothetical protein
MYDVDRIEVLEQGGLRAAEVHLPSEGQMITALASVAVGIKAWKK